jgi:hypothetical protein
MAIFMGPYSLGTFFRFTNDDVIAFGTRDGAFDQEEVIRAMYLNDFEVLGGAGDLAHVTGHFHAAHDGTGEQALADGAGATMQAFGAVGGITTGEPVTFDDTFKAATFGGADGIHEIADGKQIRAEDIAGFDFFGEVAEFLDAFDGEGVVLFDVTEQGFAEALFFLVVETELDGVITVFARLRFHLDNAIGAGQYNGDGNGRATGVINAGMAQFFS